MNLHLLLGCGSLSNVNRLWRDEICTQTETKWPTHPITIFIKFRPLWKRELDKKSIWRIDVATGRHQSSFGSFRRVASVLLPRNSEGWRRWGAVIPSPSFGTNSGGVVIRRGDATRYSSYHFGVRNCRYLQVRRGPRPRPLRPRQKRRGRPFET